VRVLVTGGSGFIGSHVVDRLLAAGHTPRIFDSRPSPYEHHRDVESHAGDLLDPDQLRAAAQDCQAIAHLAAVADVDEVTKDPARAEEVNSRGTINVLEAARAAGVERVVYASTIWVYSDTEGSVDEEQGLGLPAHLYTATKLAGEMYCRSYSELFGLDYTLLRFGIPYGPRARPAAVVPVFVRKAMAGEPLTIAGDGRQTRRFVYVEDLAEGVARGLEPVAANRVYNLVGDEEVTVRQIADTVRDEVGDVEIVHTEGRAGDFKGAEISGRRAEEELAWKAETPFAEGVRRYVSWYREEQLEQPPEPVPEAVAAESRAPAVALGAAAVLVLAGCLELLHRAGADLTALAPAVFVFAGYFVVGGRMGRWTNPVRVGLLLVVLGVLWRWPDEVREAIQPDLGLALVVFTVLGAVASAATLDRRLRARESEA
jgi:UDP-glucose 4-epimerase